MSKDEFIAAHLKVCTAKRALKYDVKKSGAAAHTIEYSRRKCAKALWRRMQKESGGGAKQ